jgi:drug/metabolite transporter (DMT)-like permease
MTWLLWGVYGALGLAFVNSMFRLNLWNFSFWPLLLLMVIPTTLVTQLGFLKFYNSAPSFLVAWFLGSALTSITGFAASVLIFKEAPNFLNGLGIGLILLGGYLLTK